MTIFLTIFATIILAMIVLPMVIILMKKGTEPRAYKSSYIIMVFFVVQWLLFLTDFYALLPVAISTILFDGVWILLCIAGVIGVIREMKNRMILAIPLAGFTLISGMFFVLAFGMT